MVILSLRNLPDVPSATMLKVFRGRADELREANGRLMLAGIDPTLLHTLHATHLDEVFGRENLFAADEPVFEALEQAVAAADRWLGTDDRPGPVHAA